MASQAHIHYHTFLANIGPEMTVNAQHCPAISCNLAHLPPMHHAYLTIYAEPQQKSYWEKQVVTITITDFNTKMQHFMHFPTQFPNGFKKTYLNMLLLSVIKLNWC